MKENEENWILFSIIGKGRERRDGARGYEKTRYVFNTKDKDKYITRETAFFGLALLEYLKEVEQLSIDKFIIVGTDKSAWSELLMVIPYEQQNDSMSDLYLKVYEQENAKTEKEALTDEMLKEWEAALKKFLPFLSLHMVKPLDFKVYLDIILKELEIGKKYSIVFDCTHGFRYIPIVFSYALMFSKYLRNIDKIRIFYGAFEMKDYSLPGENYPLAIEVGFVNEAVKLIEAMSIFENSGYFTPLLDCIGIDNTEETYFKIEMNRPLKKEVEDIMHRLKDTKQKAENYYEKEISDYLLKEFEEMQKQDRLYLRMFKRAQFFFERNQYFKALILLYEAIIVLFADVYGIKDLMNYKSREKSRNMIKNEIKQISEYKSPEKNKLIKSDDEVDIYRKLEYIRNAAAHGSEARTDQNLLHSPQAFKELFESACELFSKMLKRKEVKAI